MEIEQNKHTIMLDEKYESYKAEKNSKGWNFEVKMISNPAKTDEENVARLKKITDMLENNYAKTI